MGLLDFASDPEGMQGLALLAAAGPSMVPQNFASRLASAGDTYRGLLSDQLKQQYTRAQIDDMTQQIGLRGLELQQKQQQFDMMKPILSAVSDAYRNAGAGTSAGPQPPSQPAIPAAPGGALGSGTFGVPLGGQTAAANAPAGAGSSGPTGSVFGVPLNVAGPTLALGGPAKFADAISTFNAPTDFAKSLSAKGVQPGSPEWTQQMTAYLQKQTYIPPASLRPGGYAAYPDGRLEQMPTAPEGFQNIKGADGAWHTVPVDGGVQALTTSAGAKNFGKVQTTLNTGVEEGTGKPVFALGLPPGTIGAPAAGGAGGSEATQLRGQVAGPMGADPAALEREIRATQNDMMKVKDAPSREALQQHLADLQATRQQVSNAPFVRPGNAPGFNESQTVLAKGNAERYNGTLTQASDSPTRVNVFDNILNLSRQGVNSGPGEQWKNTIRGFAANTPFLSSVTGKWKDEVAGFQELQKFMYQNAQRSWQAAGGTGTDSQLESFTRANPNDKMFPQALQQMAEWGKAGELALQGKTNAMQAWKDQNGGNVANLDGFERAWRNNFDPLLFQLKTMDPARQQAYVQNLKTTNPSAYASLMMKASTLKNLGGL